MRKGVLLIGILLLFSCTSRTPKGLTQIKGKSLAVVKFYQPLDDRDLIAGIALENQRKISKEQLEPLDIFLEQELLVRGNNIVVGDKLAICKKKNALQKKKISAFKYWLRIGECAKVDFLLVPQIISWEPLKKIDTKIVEPAKIILELYLMDIKNKKLLKRFYFTEKHVKLVDNVFGVDNYFSIDKSDERTAEIVAKEGIITAIMEFGL